MIIKQTGKQVLTGLLTKHMLKIIEGNYDQKGEKCVADINAQNADWEGVPEL